jgi:hypothetical protein
VGTTFVASFIGLVYFSSVAAGAVFYYFEVKAVNKTNREAKRMANAHMSPLLGTINDCVNGRLLLQISRCEGYMSKRFSKSIDDWCKCMFLSGSLINWGSLVSYVISCALSTITATVIVVHRSQYSQAQVGMALSYSFLIPYFLQFLSLHITMFEMGMTSLERLLEYKGDRVAQEPAWFLPSDPMPMVQPKLLKTLNRVGTKSKDMTSMVNNKVSPGMPGTQWPAQGQVEFKVGIFTTI